MATHSVVKIHPGNADARSIKAPSEDPILAAEELDGARPVARPSRHLYRHGLDVPRVVPHLPRLSIQRSFFHRGPTARRTGDLSDRQIVAEWSVPAALPKVRENDHA